MLYILIGLAVWLVVLTFFFVRFVVFFKKLTKGTKEDELVKVLNRILVTQKENTDDIKKCQREIVRLEEEGKIHVQKVGLVRFNPFKEIGGDHSFSLAILDGTDSGVIVTCLHTRERTRVYMKAIKKGKSELDLSDEEKKALEKAKAR